MRNTLNISDQLNVSKAPDFCYNRRFRLIEASNCERLHNWWFLGVADHQMTSPLACYQPLQMLIWVNECKIFVGLSVPTNSLTNFDLIKREFY